MANPAADAMHGSWSGKFAADGTPAACGSTPATEICRNGPSCDEGNPVVARLSDTEYGVPTVRDTLASDSEFSPFSVAACYCSHPAHCQDTPIAFQDFVQQVGVN
jgi:hypothetical protein